MPVPKAKETFVGMESPSSVPAFRPADSGLPCAADTLLTCHSGSSQAANLPRGSHMIDSRRAEGLASG